MVFNKKVDNKIIGMDSIAFMREVMLNDEKIEEQGRILQESFNEVNSEMAEREFNPNLMQLRDLNIESDEYDLFNKYIFGLSTFLSTKKLMSSIGIEFDNTSEVDMTSLMFLNKDVQSVLPELSRRFLTSFNNAMETGEINDCYEYMYNIIAEDVSKQAAYSYETIGSNFESVSDYEDYIDSVVESITERMYKTKYTMGILMSYNKDEFERAKTSIIDLFKKYNVNVEDLMNEVMPEQLISEPSQFQTLLQSYLTSNSEIMAQLTEVKVQADIQKGITEILIELSNTNAITKFNQTNGMMGNVFPTINISELIVMSLFKLGNKVSKMEELDDIETEIVRILDGIVFDKLGTREAQMGIRLNDVHLNLLSTIPLYVSDIVVDQLSLRAVDGSFQAMCSSVMNSIVETINGYVNIYSEEVKKGE